MVLGKKVAIFDWEWAEIRPLEKGRKCPEEGVVGIQWQTINYMYCD